MVLEMLRVKMCASTVVFVGGKATYSVTLSDREAPMHQWRA
jgi:hypothetical protein